MFGAEGDQPLDAAAAQARFAALIDDIRETTTTRSIAAACAEGYVQIAVENMANAIKKISVQRGHDVTGYTLVCFGGAAGQHACLVADALGMPRIFIHPLAGVLSAYGMGLADITAMRESAVEARLDAALLRATGAESSHAGSCRARGCRCPGRGRSVASRLHSRAHLKYDGTDSTTDR